MALSELHQQVRTAIEAGDLERPRRICEAILAARPDNLETILLLAEIELESGHQQAAIEGFDRVLRSDPECFLAYAGLGIAFEALKDTAAAAHWFSRAFDLNPLNLEVRAERDRLLGEAYPGRPLPVELSDIATARSLLNAGLAEQSLTPFRRALAQEPGRQEIRVGLAEALWALGLHGEAIGACRMALTDVPRAVKIHAILASIAADEGDAAQARAMLTDIRAQDPDGRISGRFLLSSPIADSAIELVDLPIDPRRLPSRQMRVGPAESPHWVGWMRKGLWQVLRLLLTPIEAEEAGLASSGPPSAHAAAPPSAPAGVRPKAAEPPTARLPPRPTPASVRTSGPLGKRIQGAGTPPAGLGGDAKEAERREPMVSEEVVRVPIIEPERPRQPAPKPTPPPAAPPKPTEPPTARLQPRRPPSPPADDDDARTEVMELSPAALKAMQRQERGRST